MTHTDLRDEASREIRLARIMSSSYMRNDKRYAAVYRLSRDHAL